MDHIGGLTDIGIISPEVDGAKPDRLQNKRFLPESRM
jgi:hypothetical protein